MRSPRLSAACALLGLLPSAACALNIPTFDPGNDAPMPAKLVQLYTDLAAIASGATVTDGQHQALVADLDALATGLFVPDPTAVDQLATDLGTAASSDLFSDNVVQSLADDFIGDPDTPASWLEDIQDDVASLVDPPPPNSYQTFDPTTDGPPVVTSVSPTGIAYPPAANDGSFDRFAVLLDTQGVPLNLLEHYFGRAKFTIRRLDGIAPLATLTLDTVGLPPVNPYTLSMTRKSDGTSVVLGKFRVYAEGFTSILPITLSAAPSSQVGPAAELASFSHATFGAGARKPLPAGYDTSDVATLTVADAQGVVRLSGGIAGVQPTSELRVLRLSLYGPETLVGPTAFASVTARHQVKSGKSKDHFRFLAKHLPVSAPVTLLADGVVVGRYTTTGHGRLLVVEGFEPQKPGNALPPGTDLSGARVFTVDDAHGTVLLSGGSAAN